MSKTHTPKILVVDDEKDIRDITEAFLVLNGYEVTTATNGMEALEKLLADDFDLVITDLQMPKMDGMELLEKIAELNSPTVTIVLTGHAIKNFHFSKEPFAHLRKPFSHKQLIEIVQEGLKCSHAS